ncbi:unnamed protein product [Pleuronectes platessa]|uniref:Uncharacterized protein n=1 Tax=Pleuronectes platessa TaxID=8262 RepID=A0A9N7V946_PLEPL|nr:unnamed protein product [Pleuronectes platessa]
MKRNVLKTKTCGFMLKYRMKETQRGFKKLHWIPAETSSRPFPLVPSDSLDPNIRNRLVTLHKQLSRKHAAHLNISREQLQTWTNTKSWLC